MKKIDWTKVLSFVVPGLGQIGKGELLIGYLWFIGFYSSIAIVVFYGYGWLILTFIIHVANVLNTEELLT